MPTLPYGLWPSPITAKDVAAGARRFGMVQGDGAWIYWSEGRPEERGRQTLMRARADGQGLPEELLAHHSSAPSVAHTQPAQYSARSRVHEYGGGEFLAVDGRVWFVNDSDQDIYELDPGDAPRRLTSAPDLRFSDLTLDRTQRRLIAVGERHAPGAAMPDNLIVAVDLDGAERGRVTDLVRGRDFYMSPRISPDGQKLAWIAWDLPGMPWDEAELLLAPFDRSDRVRKPRRIAGGKGTAASHPAWAPDGQLVYVSDASGHGLLMRFDGRRSVALAREPLEFGRPPWVFGSAPYTIDGNGTVWAAPLSPRRPDPSRSELLEIPPRRSRRVRHRIDAATVDGLVAADGAVAGIAAHAAAPTAITSFSVGPRLTAHRLRPQSDLGIGPEDVSVPRVVYFQEGRQGARVYALYYPPCNRRCTAPPGSKPPALVLTHGGPTASADRGLKLRTQFYTSRGFAVLDVDYAGSTGYGRAYRERLDGQWGLADVGDCEAAAIYLSLHGLADPGRIAIAGGSAGGYTVLMALATSPVFKAGSSHYGISDLTLLMEHTHKFESGYLHRLLGTTPESWKDVCRARSPISLADGIRAPLVLFQGLEDKVVPPEQSRLIHDSLRRRGIACDLHEFPGEGHGFRRAETIIAVLEAELGFLQRALRIS